MIKNRQFAWNPLLRCWVDRADSMNIEIPSRLTYNTKGYSEIHEKNCKQNSELTQVTHQWSQVCWQQDYIEVQRGQQKSPVNQVSNSLRGGKISLGLDRTPIVPNDCLWENQHMPCWKHKLNIATTFTIVPNLTADRTRQNSEEKVDSRHATHNLRTQNCTEF